MFTKKVGIITYQLTFCIQPNRIQSIHKTTKREGKFNGSPHFKVNYGQFPPFGDINSSNHVFVLFPGDLKWGSAHDAH